MAAIKINNGIYLYIYKGGIVIGPNGKEVDCDGEPWKDLLKERKKKNERNTRMEN